MPVSPESRLPSSSRAIDDFARVMAINVNGVFYLCRAVIPHMRAHRYGRIVNIASIAGKEGNPNMISYSGSKAAVIGMTKSLGKEGSYGRHLRQRRVSGGGCARRSSNS